MQQDMPRVSSCLRIEPETKVPPPRLSDPATLPAPQPRRQRRPRVGEKSDSRRLAPTLFDLDQQVLQIRGAHPGDARSLRQCLWTEGRKLLPSFEGKRRHSLVRQRDIQAQLAHAAHLLRLLPLALEIPRILDLQLRGEYRISVQRPSHAARLEEIS